MHARQPMTGKLKAKSPARLLLAKKFLSGEILGQEDPKEVRESEEAFRQHKLRNFRTHYNKMRKEHADSAGGYTIFPPISDLMYL